MSDHPPRPGSNWQVWLDEACRQSQPESGNPRSIRRSLSILPEAEREELDGHLSTTLKDEESEAMSESLLELEEILSDQPLALELLETIRFDLARTALRCIEESYRFGKRRGQREALDLLLPYTKEWAGIR